MTGQYGKELEHKLGAAARFSITSSCLENARIRAITPGTCGPGAHLPTGLPSMRKAASFTKFGSERGCDGESLKTYAV